MIACALFRKISSAFYSQMLFLISTALATPFSLCHPSPYEIRKCLIRLFLHPNEDA